MSRCQSRHQLLVVVIVKRSFDLTQVGEATVGGTGACCLCVKGTACGATGSERVPLRPASGRARVSEVRPLHLVRNLDLDLN